MSPNISGSSSNIFNFFGVRDWVRDTLIESVITLEPDFNTIDYELTQREAQLNRREEQLFHIEAVLSGLEEELVGFAEFLAPAQFDNFAEFVTAFARGLIGIENQLTTREAQLDRRSAALDRREEGLLAREIEEIPMFRRFLTPEELEEINSVARLYINMAPATAAQILTELEDPFHVATILHFMGERNAAAILAILDVDFAAELTLILMGVD